MAVSARSACLWLQTSLVGRISLSAAVSSDVTCFFYSPVHRPEVVGRVPRVDRNICIDAGQVASKIAVAITFP